MFKGLFVAFSMAAAFFMFPAIAWSGPDIPNFPVSQQLDIYSFPAYAGVPNANNLLAEANQVRKNAGVQPLRAHKGLTELAGQRAADMSVRRYYSHKNPDGNYYYDIMSHYGYKPDYSCENLDLVFTYSDSIVISDWLNSSKGHRECLLNPEAYEIGLAVVAYDTIVVNGQRRPVYLVVAIHATNF